MVLWIGRGGGRVRLPPKRMILSGSFLMMVLFYYVSLPDARTDGEVSFTTGGARVGKAQGGSALSDDTDIVMDATEVVLPALDQVPHGAWLEPSVKKTKSYGKSSKAELRGQRNYRFEESSVVNDDVGSMECGLTGNTEWGDERENSGDSSSKSCSPPSRTKNEDESMLTDKEKEEQESIQMEDDEQGRELEDGSSSPLSSTNASKESAEDQEDLEEKETIAATIEAEIEREEAEARKAAMAKGKDKNKDKAKGLNRQDVDVFDEVGRDDEEDEADVHQFVEGLFQGSMEESPDSVKEEAEETVDHKEDRLGQAGPLETLDDEE
ncbi:hypothetical protein BGZ94_002452 [Podila epigama]|nr:hypothetical protein BGZ94_002452 [Podila epigama]